MVRLEPQQDEDQADHMMSIIFNSFVVAVRNERLHDYRLCKRRRLQSEYRFLQGTLRNSSHHFLNHHINEFLWIAVAVSSLYLRRLLLMKVAYAPLPFSRSFDNDVAKTLRTKLSLKRKRGIRTK